MREICSFSGFFNDFGAKFDVFDQKMNGILATREANLGLCGAPAGRNYDDRWILGRCNARLFLTIIRCLPGVASGRF